MAENLHIGSYHIHHTAWELLAGEELVCKLQPRIASHCKAIGIVKVVLLHCAIVQRGLTALVGLEAHLYAEGTSKEPSLTICYLKV